MTARWAVRTATETEPSRRRNGVGETEPLMGHHRKQAGAMRLPATFCVSLDPGVISFPDFRFSSVCLDLF